MDVQEDLDVQEHQMEYSSMETDGDIAVMAGNIPIVMEAAPGETIICEYYIVNYSHNLVNAGHGGSMQEMFLQGKIFLYSEYLRFFIHGKHMYL